MKAGERALFSQNDAVQSLAVYLPYRNGASLRTVLSQVDKRDLSLSPVSTHIHTPLDTYKFPQNSGENFVPGRKAFDLFFPSTIFQEHLLSKVL